MPRATSSFHILGQPYSCLTDITYIATDEGWLYLAAVIDLFSRQVVGRGRTRTDQLAAGLGPESEPGKWKWAAG